MKIEDKLRILGSFFSLPAKERATYLGGIDKTTVLIYDEDDSSTENVLYFLCVHYLDVVATCHNTENVKGETFYRELMAVLNVFFNLPVNSDYVWNYSKESYDGGVFDDLWFIVARLSRVTLAHHGWKSDVPTVGVNELVNEILTDYQQ